MKHFNLKYFFLVLIFPLSIFSLENKTKIMLKPNQQLLVLAPPSVHNTYYKQFFPDMTKFYINYISQIIGKDEVLVLLDADTYPYFKDKIPDENIYITDEIYDIWMRDFTSVGLKKPVQFRYTESYLGKRLAKKTQKKLNQFLKKLDIKLERSNYFLDGGNFVNYENRAIISERLLEDNKFQSLEKAKKYFQRKLDHEISIIPYDDEVMGHSDGMVMLTDKNTVFVNKYEEPFREEVMLSLKRDFSDIKIIEMPSKSFPNKWKGFYSACGIYVNSVVTKNYIYMPTFDLDLDKENLEIIKKNTTKKVIPIDAKQVCFMGGSLRCLSWQLSAKFANRLLKKISEKQE